MDAEITRMLDEGCPHGHDDEVAREVERQGWVELGDGTRVSLPVETIDLADAPAGPGTGGTGRGAVGHRRGGLSDG